MAVPNPPAIDSAPSPAPTRTDPANFRARADAYHSWLVPWVNVQLPALIEWIRARANDVFSLAIQTQADRVLVQAAAASIANERPSENAAAAAASAAQAAAYASQAQATNPDSPIRLNPSRVTADFAVPSGYNAASVGPITVSEGVTVTIQDNAIWSVH